MARDRRPAVLALADGTVFHGCNFGAEGEAFGEICFNTGMVGYQEVLTDPSYRGQIVTMTYPEIGNYGINPQDMESWRPWVEGFVVREYNDHPSNWRSNQNLGGYLADIIVNIISFGRLSIIRYNMTFNGKIREIIKSFFVWRTACRYIV